MVIYPKLHHIINLLIDQIEYTEGRWFLNVECKDLKILQEVQVSFRFIERSQIPLQYDSQINTYILFIQIYRHIYSYQPSFHVNIFILRWDTQQLVGQSPNILSTLSRATSQFFCMTKEYIYCWHLFLLNVHLTPITCLYTPPW